MNFKHINTFLFLEGNKTNWETKKEKRIHEKNSQYLNKLYCVSILFLFLFVI